MLEKTLESPLDSKEIKPVNPKWNQSWIFIGRTDAEAESPIFWPPFVKNLLIEKYLDTGKDWRQDEKGTTEDEMIRWHHRLNGHEFEMDREVSCATVHGVTKKCAWLSDCTEMNWNSEVEKLSQVALSSTSSEVGLAVVLLWLSEVGLGWWTLPSPLTCSDGATFRHHHLFAQFNPCLTDLLS